MALIALRDSAGAETMPEQMLTDHDTYRAELHTEFIEWLILLNEPDMPQIVPVARHAHPAPVVVSVGAGTEQWRGLVSQFFLPEHVDATLSVMNCESGGLATAANPNSSARGLMQIMRGWYSGDWSTVIPAFDPFDPELNIKYAAVIFYAHTPEWRDWVCKP